MSGADDETIRAALAEAGVSHLLVNPAELRRLARAGPRQMSQEQALALGRFLGSLRQVYGDERGIFVLALERPAPSGEGHTEADGEHEGRQGGQP